MTQQSQGGVVTAVRDGYVTFRGAYGERSVPAPQFTSSAIGQQVVMAGDALHRLPEVSASYRV